MNTNIAIGDTVKVLRASTAWGHMEGVEGEVLDILEDSKAVLVKDPTGQGMWPREGGSGWWFSTRDVEKIEPVEPKVGDTVRVLKTSNWHKLGETGKVTEVDGLSIRVNDWWISPKEVELVTEKPKAKSQEIELGDVQKNDLIVCFWSQGGVELRKKGVAYEKDHDGDWIAEGREYLTYDDSHDAAEHVYLLERTEKEPVGFDALDKSKTYEAKPKPMSSYLGTYYLKFVSDAWRFSYNDVEVRESNTTARGYEADLIEGKTSWEKPVEYKEPELADGTYWIKAWGDIIRVEVKGAEATFYRPDGSATNDDYDYLLRIKRGESSLDLLTEDPTPPKTDLDKHTEAGTIGNRYRAGNVLYKVTKKGKVKGIITNDAQDSWQTVIWDFETFQDYVDRGIIHKIS